MKSKWFFRIAVVFLAGFAALSAIVMVLWNWLIPVLFSGPVITFWQSAGLLLLSKILFKGFHKGGHMWRQNRWKAWKERFEKMSPEERERMRSFWKQRCCSPFESGFRETAGGGEESPK